MTFLLWLWITNIAILFGAELNAEIERSRQMRDGVAGAADELKVPERDTPKRKRRARTA